MSNTFCDYYNKDICRSCEWLEESLPAQIQKKELLLEKALSFLSPFALEKSVASAPQAFRNRAKWIVTGSTTHPLIGLPGKIDLDSGRDLQSCPIVHPRILELTKALPALISEFSLKPYRIVERTGELKALIVFYSPHSQQMYLRFVLRSQEAILRIKKLLPKLQAAFPDLRKPRPSRTPTFLKRCRQNRNPSDAWR